MKYAPSALGLGQLSGSTGGSTASRNRYGSYIRARTVPVNPRTPLQTARRELLASLSANWRFLSLAEQASWNNVALEISKSDTLGIEYNPTGHQLYVGNNLMRAIDGTALVDVAPALDAPEIVTAFTASAFLLAGVFDQIEIALNPSAFSVNQKLAVYASPPSSSGKTFFGHSELRLLDIFTAPTDPVDITALYTAKFGTTAFDDQRIMVAGVPISPNYYRGAELRSMAIVTTP